MINRTEAPAIFPIDSIPFALPKTVTSEAGTAFLMHNSDYNIVKIEWQLNAGRSQQSKALEAQIAWMMTLEGTQKYDSDKLAELLDFYNAKIKYRIEADYAIVTVWIYKKHWLEVLELINEVLHHATFDPRDFENYIALQYEKTKLNEQKNDYIASLNHAKDLFEPNNPIGNYFTSDDYKHIALIDVLTFYNKNIKPSKGQLYVSGNASHDNVLELMAIMPSEKQQFSSKPFDYTKNKSIKNELKIENSTQASIRISTLLPTKNHGEYIDLMLLNTALGGYFGSRLMDNLREEKGYTYGIHSFISNYFECGWWQISTEVGVEVKEVALQEIYNEINKLIEVPMEADELQNVKNALLQELLTTCDGIHNMLATYRSFNTYNMHTDCLQLWLKTIINYTPQHLQSIADKYLANANWVETVVC
jgi:predicted Zn-dependent peptidase